MRSVRSLGFLTVLLTIVLLGAGCSVKVNSKQSNDGGVFRSADKGETWAAKVAVPTVNGAPLLINTVNVKRILIDPSDHATLYLVTSNGIFYSYTNGDEWLIPRDQPQEFKTAEDLAVDPNNSCALYVSAVNKIFKSTTCGRTWKQMYFGTRATDIVTALAVDWYNPEIVYAGTSEGNLLQSTDAGLSWTTIRRVNNKITRVALNARDSRVFYVVTESAGIQKTTDRGANWTEIKDQFKDYKDSIKIKDFGISGVNPNNLYAASAYGILRSTDAGSSWKPLALLTAPNKANILALVVDPENEHGIYYTTESTFYTTLDGGENWISQKLPTTRAGTALAIDFENPNVIYLGVTQLGK